MAGSALLSEAALVYIVRFVAIQTIVARHVEGMPCMALLARNSHMQAEEGEAREVVVEAGDQAPILRYVTIITGLAQPAGVDIAGPVTARAVRGQFAGREGSRVAGIALDLGVLPKQLPTTVALVIESG